MDESKHGRISNNTNDNSNVPSKYTINNRSAIRMNDFKIQYKGNYMIFNTRNIDKPQVLRLVLMPNEDYCFVCNHTEGDKNEVLKWTLQSKQLQEQVRYMKYYFLACANTLPYVRVTYKGKIKNKKHKKEETFIIEQKTGEGWYPIKYDLKRINKTGTNYQITVPNAFKHTSFAGGKTLQTAIKLKEFYDSGAYMNTPQIRNGDNRAPNGINQRLTEYVESHDVLKKEEIQGLYDQPGTKVHKREHTLSPEDLSPEDYALFLRFKKFMESEESVKIIKED